MSDPKWHRPLLPLNYTHLVDHARQTRTRKSAKLMARTDDTGLPAFGLSKSKGLVVCHLPRSSLRSTVHNLSRSLGGNQLSKKGSEEHGECLATREPANQTTLFACGDLRQRVGLLELWGNG